MAICGKVVCNFCSEEDPPSDNEMHRIYKDLSHCYTNYEARQTYASPLCDKILKTRSTLNNLTTKTHPEGFDSVVGLSQICLQINKSVEEQLLNKTMFPN